MIKQLCSTGYFGEMAGPSFRIRFHWTGYVRNGIDYAPHPQARDIRVYASTLDEACALIKGHFIHTFLFFYPDAEELSTTGEVIHNLKVPEKWLLRA